jgi:hypothetical protein
VKSPDEDEPPVPDWLTLNVLPPTVMVPLLELLLELELTL